MAITTNYEQAREIIPEGTYEFKIGPASVATTKGGTEYISIPMTIRNDIDQQQKGRVLYHAIWNRTGNGRGGLWIRNNGSTLTSQAVDTVIFTTLAFWGVYPAQVFFSILLTTYLFKAVVALLDTPFMYLARSITPIEEKGDRYERTGKSDEAWQRAERV